MCGANIDHKSYSDLLLKGQNYINKNKSIFEVCCLNKFSIFIWHLMAFPFFEICQGGVSVKHFLPKTLGHLL